MSDSNRKESRFFARGRGVNFQTSEEKRANMESTSPLGYATASPSAKTTTSPVKSPNGAESTMSRPLTRISSQQNATPGSNRNFQHSRVSSNDSVVTSLRVDSPGSPGGGRGSDDVSVTHSPASQSSTRRDRSDTVNAVTSRYQDDQQVLSPPSTIPSSLNAATRMVSIASITRPSGQPRQTSNTSSKIASPRDESAYAPSAHRNLGSQPSNGSRYATLAGSGLLAPAPAGDATDSRITEQISAQNLHALAQRNTVTQENIIKMLAQEMTRTQGSIDALSKLAGYHQQRIGNAEDRINEVEQLAVGTGADLLARIDHVEQQVNAMRVQTVQNTPVLGQFPQFQAGPPFSHPGHVQQPMVPMHPAYQPRSQHSSNAPRGQRNFRVNMMQLPPINVNVPSPILDTGPQTPKAQIIPTLPYGAPPGQDKISSITPNPSDDVFGPCAPGPLPKAQFGQKSYRELMSSIFTRSESLVRQYFRSNYYANSKDPRAVHVVKLAASHMSSRQAAEKTLADPNLRVFVFIGIVHRWLVNHIYKQPLLDGYTDADTAGRFKALFEKEFWYQENGAIYAMEYGIRRNMTVERSKICSKIAQQPGFWKWTQNLASSLTDDFMNDFSSLIPVHQLGHAREEFFRVITDVAKVGIRMRQEPFFFEIIFYRFGVRFEYKGMIQRNEEFKGMLVDANPPQHVIRVSLSPCVIQKGFENNTLQMETILKGEVHLTDRQGNLR